MQEWKWQGEQAEWLAGEQCRGETAEHAGSVGGGWRAML